MEPAGPLPAIYGDPELTDRRAGLEQESQRQQHKLEMAKFELEKEKMAIQKEIEEAEIDQEAKDHIRDMAMRSATKATGNRHQNSECESGPLDSHVKCNT